MASLSFISASKLVERVSAADPRKDMYVWVLSANRLALGIDPLQPTHVLDLSKERISPCNSAELAEFPGRSIISSTPETQTLPSDQYRPKITRRSGDYWFENKGARVECRTLKELLSKGLEELEKNQPGTLEKLSSIKPRSRRIVAREPNQLFGRAHLVEAYSEKLKDGWWFGTNNSANETNTWLRRACECAGLKWDEDFKTSLTPTIEDLI